MDEFSVGAPTFSPLGQVVPNTWTEPSSDGWLVRGPDYLKQQQTNVVSLKQPSKDSPYICVGVNVFKSPVAMSHSSQKVEKLRQFLSEQPSDEETDGLPRFLVICWMFSNVFGTDNTLVQHVFKLNTKPKGEDLALDAAVKRFMKANDDQKNAQFKYMFKVVEGPAMMTSVVGTLGGERPVLIGKRLTTKYFRGHNYLEIDMDVGSSMVASMLNSTILQSAGSAIVDEAWCFEAQNEDELPERILAKVRWNFCDPSSLYINLDDEGRIVRS